MSRKPKETTTLERTNKVLRKIMAGEQKQQDPNKMTLTENFAEVRSRLTKIEKKLDDVPTKTDLTNEIQKVLDRLPPKP